MTTKNTTYRVCVEMIVIFDGGEPILDGLREATQEWLAKVGGREVKVEDHEWGFSGVHTRWEVEEGDTELKGRDIRVSPN